MKFDHVAVQSRDISGSVSWYQENFDCKVLYQDDTWAMIEIHGLCLAFVTPGQHPAHVAFCVSEEEVERLYKGKKLKTHRDGTKSFYLGDNENNKIEIIVRPDDQKD